MSPIDNGQNSQYVMNMDELKLILSDFKKELPEEGIVGNAIGLYPARHQTWYLGCAKAPAVERS